MHLVNSAAWMWGLLAIPIIAFYILKTRLRRLPVSSLMFWESVFHEKKARSIWRRLRHLVSLLLQIVFLALIVLAIAEPRWSSQTDNARRVILVLDESASMNVGDDAESRLQQARHLAKSWIRGLRGDDEMAILSVAGTTSVRCGLTSHQATLRRSVDRVSGTDAPADLRDAIQTARQLIADHEPAEIIVITDRPPAATARQKDVRFAIVGETVGNVALTRFQVRRSLADPMGYDILVEVANFSNREVNCELSFELRDQEDSGQNNDAAEIVNIIPLRLALARRWREVRSASNGKGGTMIARLNQQDAMNLDNVAFAILPHRRRQRVILVSEQTWFLRKAFESVPLVNLEIVQQPPAKPPAEAILVFHRKTPPNIPAGNVLVIDPQASSQLWKLGSLINDPLIARHNEQHELLRHIRLDNVLLQDARRLEFADADSAAGGAPLQVESLLETASDETVLAAITNEQRKVVVLTANLAKGDLALRTSFPILISNAINWFQNRRGEWEPAIASGQTMDFAGLQQQAATSTDPPWKSRPEVLLTSPSGVRRLIPLSGGRATLGPFDECGLWRLSTSASPSTPARQIACNLSNPSESELSVDKPETQQTIPNNPDRGWPLWMAFVAIGVVLTSLEWWLYQRRLVG